MSTNYSDDARAKWYDRNPPNLKPETRELLEKYSKVPPDEILTHLQSIVLSTLNCLNVTIC